MSYWVYLFDTNTNDNALVGDIYRGNNLLRDNVNDDGSLKHTPKQDTKLH